MDGPGTEGPAEAEDAVSRRSVLNCCVTFPSRAVLLRWRSSDPGLGFAVQVLRGAIQREAVCSNTRCPRAGWLVSAGSALLRVLRPSLHPRALGPASASRGAGGEKHRHSQPQPRSHGGKALSTQKVPGQTHQVAAQAFGAANQ